MATRARVIAQEMLDKYKRTVGEFGLRICLEERSCVLKATADTSREGVLAFGFSGSFYDCIRNAAVLFLELQRVHPELDPRIVTHQGL